MSATKLDAIIVGSGLAGLAAAVVLREHHNVTVYEKGGRDAATGGQGISLFPNGLKILRAMGFDSDRVGAVPCSGYRNFDKDFNSVSDFPIDFKGRYGADMMMMKRSDFRDELLRLATAPGTEENGLKGEPAKVVFNTAVVDLDPENASITLGDDSIVKGDFVVEADGIHSKIRHRITGDDTIQPKKMGFTLFRAAASSADVEKALGYLPKWWTAEGGENRLSLMAAPGKSYRMIVHYPIQNHNWRNFSCFLPMAKERGSAVESWYADADREEMLPLFDDFHEEIRKILGVSTEVKVWDLQDLDPLPTWTRGRAIVIGDAAHGMTPLQGQGANQASEDAEALRLIGPGESHAGIEAALKKMESVRRPRTIRVLQDTRNQAGDVSMEERVSKMDYNCSYNGILEALKELA